MAHMDVDELYGLPLERFIPERTALARELRSGGRREEASAVAALRKPSVAAWAVNQLVRTQGRPVAQLLSAGDALRQAQSGVLAGRADARALRSGADQVRSAVQALVDAAGGLLSSSGHQLSPATLDRVAETLQAAALDDDARAAVSQGRLERELRHVGLGVGGGLDAGGADKPGRPARDAKRDAGRDGGEAAAGARRRGRADDAAARRDEARPRAQAEEAEARREEARKRARGAERAARRELDRADRALHAAEQRRDRAAETLRQADEQLAQARSDAAAAAEAHRRAEDQLSAP